MKLGWVGVPLTLSAVFFFLAFMDPFHHPIPKDPIIISIELSEEIVYDELDVPHTKLVINEVVWPMSLMLVTDVSGSMPTKFEKLSSEPVEDFIRWGWSARQ